MNHDRYRRSHALLGALAFAILACASLSARSQTVDDNARPIRLVVPFAAGGPADTLARTLAPRLSEQLKQPVVVDNRPGAGGTIGADTVAKAAPDGHTLLVSTSSTHAIAPVLNPRLSYDTEADFTPIAALADAPGIVLVPRDAPARSLREFVEQARREPGRLSYGSSGNGTIVHLATELFKAETGTYLVHIPYRGTAQAMNDLIAGTIDVLFDSLVTGLPQVRDGKVRALAVTSLRPTTLAPDVPPVAELLPGYEAVTCFGLYGPRGMAHDNVVRLNRAVNAVIGDAEIRERLARLGAEPTGGEPHSLSDRMRVETAKWRRIVRERGIRAD
jgi:tripartite-type tricarboxylate transporter receptor subunit TctC